MAAAIPLALRAFASLPPEQQEKVVDVGLGAIGSKGGGVGVGGGGVKNMSGNLTSGGLSMPTSNSARRLESSKGGSKGGSSKGGLQRSLPLIVGALLCCCCCVFIIVIGVVVYTQVK